MHDRPQQGSGLTLAEGALSGLSRPCTKGRLPSPQALQDAVSAGQAERNGYTAKVHWRFTTADAPIRLKHLYPKIHE